MIVGKAEDGPADLVRDNARVQRHVVRVLVQAVVNAPQRALLIGHRVVLSVVALPAQSHLSSPLEHGVILVRAIADSSTTVGLQAVVLQADPLGRGVVGELGALAVLQVGRCELQEKRRVRKGLPVEIGNAVHRRHPHVGTEPGLLQAGSAVDGVGVTVFGRPGLAVHSCADADPGDAGIAVIARGHGAHEVIVMSQVGFVPVARNDPIVIVVLITDNPGFGLDRGEPRRHRVASAIVAIVDCEGDTGWLAESSLGLQPPINKVPAVFILVWLQVSPVENVITTNNGVFSGVKVAEVVENVDAGPGCAGQPPHRTRPICRRRNRCSVASQGGQDARTGHKQQGSRDHQGSERASSPKRWSTPPHGASRRACPRLGRRASRLVPCVERCRMVLTVHHDNHNSPSATAMAMIVPITPSRGPSRNGGSTRAKNQSAKARGTRGMEKRRVTGKRAPA